jgi:hypothetical protein
VPEAVEKKDGKLIILFHYHMNKSSAVVKEAIRCFRGYLQTDGLADQALELIGKLFHIDDALRKSLHNADEFAVARRAQLV